MVSFRARTCALRASLLGLILPHEAHAGVKQYTGARSGAQAEPGEAPANTTPNIPCKQSTGDRMLVLIDAATGRTRQPTKLQTRELWNQAKPAQGVPHSPSRSKGTKARRASNPILNPGSAKPVTSPEISFMVT